VGADVPAEPGNVASRGVDEAMPRCYSPAALCSLMRSALASASQHAGHPPPPYAATASRRFLNEPAALSMKH
jgi:hypothetical protein